MTRPTVMDKDRLAAFVDGELSPEAAAEVVVHLADHPQDQAYVDDLMAANSALIQAFSAPMDEPVPQALRDLIVGPMPGASVLPFRTKTSARRGVVLWGGLAAGAALAAGLALVAYLPSPDPYRLAPGQLAVTNPLLQILDGLPSGMPQTLAGGGDAMILSSFPTRTGFCREIEVIHPAEERLEVALACTDGEGWSVEVVITETLADAAQAEGFGTASGDEAQSFAPFLDRVGAGAVLSPEEEAAAIATAWTR